MILSVAGIDFSYNSTPVLRDLSFRLPAGSILALLGVNGAGKSTLLKCLNGILGVKAGTIHLGDNDILSLKPGEIARLFGYVPQGHFQYPLSVFDMVLLGRKPHLGWGPGRHDLEVVEHTLALLGLSRLAMRSVNRLSGGELQKVAIARALVQEPRVLLLDEPTSNLDLKNQLQIMELIKQAVSEQDLSAVVSVHDINLAFRYADYFLMLKDGGVHALTALDGITPEVIWEVYGVDVILTKVEGYTVVLPLQSPASGEQP
ncbi:MAG: iron ABC transporter ATP-binding protein [Deltaproteobacteria bacterium]|nr:MAG: iron ABC transporter ATP-binding protein [Deltaproteobacteria bacterium]